jgi:hypothetical protein
MNGPRSIYGDLPETTRQDLEDQMDYTESVATLERCERTITLDELVRRLGINS